MHNVTLRYIILRYVTLHYVTLCCVILQLLALLYNTVLNVLYVLLVLHNRSKLLFSALFYISLCYITLHFAMLIYIKGYIVSSVQYSLKKTFLHFTLLHISWLSNKLRYFMLCYLTSVKGNVLVVLHDDGKQMLPALGYFTLPYYALVKC